jgi:hypothetical protein
MSIHDLIVHRPATPSQLVLLLHGVGSSARELVPFGEAMAPHLRHAAIVSLQATEAAGPGWQPALTSRGRRTARRLAAGRAWSELGPNWPRRQPANTTRPTTRPARRSASAMFTSSSGRVVMGTGGSPFWLTSASNSAISP